MHIAEYNEWDFYPINLTPKQVGYPLSVLADFFTDDWLYDQMERLKDWRDYVLKDEYYTDLKKSPYGLLHFYKLNLCLIEAAHLLKDSSKGTATVNRMEELANEKSIWRDYPANLKEAELLNPNLVIESLFSEWNLPQYRTHLYEWLEYGLSAKAANEFIETSNLIYLYENLLKLYAAAWLIYQRSSKTPYLQIEYVKARVQNSNKDKSLLPVNIYQLDHVIQPIAEELVSNLVAIIRHKVSTVQAITYLGMNPNNPNLIFLLVLTSSDESRQAQALSSTIEESCLTIAPVVALVHHASNMFTAVKHGSRFFCNALSCPAVYLSGDLILPNCNRMARHHTDEDNRLWNRWHGQGKDFLSGADYYLQIKAYGAALFSLHQCVECLLIALIRELLDYRINNHNLSRLLAISQMFTGDLVGVFELDNAEGLNLFDQLKHAYVNVRYKDLYEPDEKAVTSLYQTVKRLVIVADKVYQKHLAISSL